LVGQCDAKAVEPKRLKAIAKLAMVFFINPP
jgi:hypothetical protein